MNHWQTVALTAGLVCAVAAVVIVVGLRLHGTYTRQLVKEKAEGNRNAVRRLHGQVGRGFQPDRKGKVVPAEHMRGWVFIVVWRYSDHGRLVAGEHIEWALTRRGAQRKLDRYVRPERGASNVVAVILLLVALGMAARFAPDLLSKVLTTSAVDWLQRAGDAVLAWFRSL